MKSLKGRHILITHNQNKSQPLREPLEKEGAEVSEIPMIEILPIPNKELRKDAEYDWILFTSANAVRVAADKLPQGKIAAIGPGTAKALEEYGLQADAVAEEHTGEGLLKALEEACAGSVEGKRIFLPQARIARRFLRESLIERGAEVTHIPVYDTDVATRSRKPLNKLLENSPPDLVTLASSSAVTSLFTLTENPDHLRRLTYACIGPITADTARGFGLNVPIVPEDSSMPGLAKAIIEHYKGA